MFVDKIKYIITSILLLFSFHLYSQDSVIQRNWTLNGNIKDLQLVYYEHFDNRWMLNNEVNNRLDFKWYPTSNLNMHIGMRNRFLYGDFVEMAYPYYADMLDKDNGYVDLTWVLADDSSYVLVSNFDRANLKFTKGKFEATVGRQRVNWGIGFVWTPNDIFNSFSYFDFDYEERPGCDAVRFEYYTGVTSSAQLVASLNNNKRPTIAGMYRFNKWDYDFQFLGGMMVDDIVAGAGWAGQIEGAGFRGEISYFRDAGQFEDTTGQLEATIDVDYTFKNSLYFHAAFLYNSTGTTGPAGGMNYLEIKNVSVKDFTLARYDIMGEVSYQVSPLVRADISSIFNPSDKSLFIGPSVMMSISNNWQLMLISQLFYGDKGTEFGDYGKMWFARLKWSF